MFLKIMVTIIDCILALSVVYNLCEQEKIKGTEALARIVVSLAILQNLIFIW